MNLQKEALITLHDCPYVTRSMLKRMMKIEGLLTSLPSLTPAEITKETSLPLERSAAIFKYIENPNIMKKLDINRSQYKFITLFDKEYPAVLRNIPDPPLVLYASGRIDHLQIPLNLSVVGTRTPSQYAYPSMRKIIDPLVQSKFNIVSGMAMGIDQFAHKIAIMNKGTTIAVIGSGFHHLYPRNDMNLFDKIASEQLLLSEYPPDRPARKHHFPERNRIISGLSEAVLVIEARLKSGSLITVDQALEQGKDVYALPGPIGSPTSEGCHQIIKQGAQLVHSCADIIKGYCEKN
ncbi:DNA-processing protein DprA [Halobacillus sp. A1]|uniref:DNA-processing protein DprA n=1 Tax=Halobacillus sp. A1 TaxID=2880262 RepID=UPI0020A62C43|nr:DNA-processing protein DprA [Halobacillus sp. A1]MCP3031181.1 DNA-processing protein DprA [Halobacillus sp. A1]